MTGRHGWWPGMARGQDLSGRGHGAAVAAVPLLMMGWLASQAPAPPVPSLAQVGQEAFSAVSSMKKLVLWPARVWAPVNLSTIVWPRKELSENECCT